MEAEYRGEENFDLNDDEDDVDRELESKLSFRTKITPHENIKGYADMALSPKWDLKDEPTNDEDSEFEFKMSEAYVSLHDFFEGTNLTLGRQPFEDERGWFYSAKIDALRYLHRFEDLSVDFAFGRGSIVETDLFNWEETKEIYNYLLKSQYQLSQENIVALYIIYRYDYSEDWVRPLTLGLSSSGKITEPLSYWTDFAWVKGREHAGSQGSNPRTFGFEGIGFDTGLKYEFDSKWDPSISLGYAFGEGDIEPDNGDNKGFRQNGLHYNYGKLNGIRSFNYYGEVFKPELSNLMIFSLGAGIKPTEKTSVEIVYNYFLQHHKTDAFKYTPIDADPTGQDREVGSEVDLVMSVKKFHNFDVKAIFGVFSPGEAFSEDEDETAYLFKVKIGYRF